MFRVRSSFIIYSLHISCGCADAFANTQVCASARVFGDENRPAVRKVHYLRMVHYLAHQLLFFFLRLATSSELEVKVLIRRDVKVVFIKRPQK